MPLLVKLPERARAGETVAAPAQLVDVVPTVLELLGISAPTGLPGSNLFSLNEPDESAEPAPRQILSESVYRDCTSGGAISPR